jgi:general secretion pathway protein A
MLARPELEQLAQRVIARYHLGALTARETVRYIQHRLAVAGLSTALPFDAQAMQRIHALSRGVPRRINLLCDRALLGAYASGKAAADVDIVDKAAAEVLGQPPETSRRRLVLSPRARMGAMLGLGVLVGAALFGAATLAWDALRASAPAGASSQRQAGR